MSDRHEVEVTLAADLPVGPRGGMVKADDQVKLPYAEAERLVFLGQARYDKKSAAAVPAPTDPTTTPAAAPAAEGGK